MNKMFSVAVAAMAFLLSCSEDLKPIDQTPVEEPIVEDLLKELNMQKDSDKSENIETFEDYSIISPKYIYPDNFNPENVIGSEYEYELYEVAIRRMSDLSDIRMDLTRAEQKNISIHKGDKVYLNYHNLFVYISDKPEPIYRSTVSKPPTPFSIDIAYNHVLKRIIIHLYG